MVWRLVSGLFKQKSRKAAIDPDQTINGKASPPLGEERNRPIQLVIGFDFGTSFSKVVIGEPRDPPCRTVRRSRNWRKPLFAAFGPVRGAGRRQMPPWNGSARRDHARQSQDAAH